jgi:hypothetical protein
MSDAPRPNTSSGSNPSSPATQPETVRVPVTEFHIGEELSGAKRNLPPIRMVAACLMAVAIVVAIFAFVGKAKPQGAGSIDFVTAAEVPQQDLLLVGITVTLHNTTKRPLWIHTVAAQLVTADGKTLEDVAASAVDLDRYYQAFPALKENAEPPIPPETKLLPGATQRGTLIVGFKMPKEAFAQRKSLTVAIQPYDEKLPVILK